MKKTWYRLVFGRSNTSAPTDWAITYLWASSNSSNSSSRVQIPISGIIKKARITIRTSWLWSNELWSANVNINWGSWSNLISSWLDFSVENFSGSSDMNIPVTTADYANIQVTFPTRATNPTNVVMTWSLRIEAT